jgi:hypothetical protein
MRLLSSVALTIMLAAGASAQNRPDFSGRWTIAGRAGDMGSGWGSTITLTQSASASRSVGVHDGDLQPPLVFVYPLDGSARTHTLMMGRGFEKQVSRAVWDDAKIIITTTQDFPNLSPARQSPRW